MSQKVAESNCADTLRLGNNHPRKLILRKTYDKMDDGNATAMSLQVNQLMRLPKIIALIASGNPLCASRRINEVVGLVLGVIPLLISAAEHHRIGIAPLDGLIFRAKERNRITESLDNQQLLFRQCCFRLLSIAEIENTGDLLAAGAAERWKDPNIRRRLEQALGEAFATFERLSLEIYGIIKRLQNTLDSSRISFALSSLSRDEHVLHLERKIRLLERLLEGTRYNNRANTQQLSDISMIKASRRERASLHKCITTSWGCICKETHLINLSLLPGSENGGLNLIFLSQPAVPEGAITQEQLPWSWKSVAVQSTVVASQNPQVSPQGPFKNMVHKLPSMNLSMNPCHQLCDILQNSSRCTTDINGIARSLVSSPVLLQDEDGFEHQLCFNEELQDEPDLITLNNALKLSNALSVTGSPNWFTLKDRLELAASLIYAVLQHHTLPWLPSAWTSHDVYFLQGLEGLSRETFKKPYLRAADNLVSREQEQTNHLPLISNTTLFSLAIVLIEIAYNAPLENLFNEDEKRDYENPISKLWAIPIAASRLVSGIQDRVVIPSYCEAARRCLHGDFGTLEFHEKDLSNDAFLSAVYDHTMRPLHKELQRLGLKLKCN